MLSDMTEGNHAARWPWQWRDVYLMTSAVSSKAIGCFGAHLLGLTVLFHGQLCADYRFILGENKIPSLAIIQVILDVPKNYRTSR